MPSATSASPIPAASTATARRPGSAIAALDGEACYATRVSWATKELAHIYNAYRMPPLPSPQS